MTAQNLDLTKRTHRMAEKRETSLLNGHDAGFNEIFNEHWQPLCRYLNRLTGSMQEAEDIALEAFYRLWKQPTEKVRQPKAWLYRVATNLAYNTFRTSDRRTHYEGQIQFQPGSPSQPESPQEQVERRDRQEQVRGILRKMNPRHAKVLLLRYNGFRYQEIAETLQINPRSVGKTLARAEKKFIKLYQEVERHENAPET
jgi:RNA polymerase sigma-70 factor (ECF subfamily)